jgi:biopolymer transport protein ExbD
MRLRKPTPTGAISFNFTPMIDIVFNLLIFFVLTAQFVTLEVEDVVLPSSVTAGPKDYTSYRNVVVNIINPDSPAVVVMGQRFNFKDLSEHLKVLKASAQAEGQVLNVILRADRKICYEEVARVMLAAGGAEIAGWWIECDTSEVERAAAEQATR